MRTLTLLLTATLSIFPVISAAQGLVPTIDSGYEFCQDRPPEPDWIDNLHVRESYKGLLLQSIYRFQGYERVAEAGDCSCNTLFPPWAAAMQQFNDNYGHLERHDALATRREFQDEGTALRRSVREICEAEGNW